MIPRPKNTDTMADVLKMQEDYLREKNEGKTKPAATIKRVEGGKGKNFIKFLNSINFNNLIYFTEKKSLFAKSRNLKTTEEKSDQQNLVIGEVVERKYSSSSNSMDVDETQTEDKGFPKPSVIDLKALKVQKGKSLFSQIMETKKHEDKMEIDENTTSSNYNFHEENMKILQNMTPEEILEEQQKLIKSMDPKILEFVRSKNKQKKVQFKSEQTEPKSKESKPLPDNFPILDFLKEDSAKNWIHFDMLEPEKLAWTQDIEKTFDKLKPGQTYEARFDWKGFLLPFMDNDEKVKDDRELYLHGDDPHRPGYSLQELFRLARATVLQQRVASINAIAGILNIYNQGYYDEILELPISKIFFFLRFAMDENTAAIIEASSRALAYLFYNDTDETLLDIAFETKTGILQPILDNKRAKITGNLYTEETDNDLESTLKQLSIEENRKKLFESNVDDFIDENEQDKDSVNDFHLAEVNLVECLLRTNIIERISYIITMTEPSDITIMSCVKILIRLARSGRETSSKILQKSNLIKHMIENYLRPFESHQEPHFIILKLFRIISSYDRMFCNELKNLGVIDIVKTFVSSRQDLNINLLKIQIESFRFLRLYLHLFIDESLFGEIAMSIRYLLEWHYQFLDFQIDNHFIIRQHACSLIYLLRCGNVIVIFPMFSEIFKMCCSKWFTMANRYGANEFSQKILLSTILDICGYFTNFSAEYFYDFIDDYLMRFMTSSNYIKITEEMCETSPLFKTGNDRCNVLRQLINLGSIMRRYKKSPPTLVVTQNYSIYLMKSLLFFINSLDNMNSIKNQDYYRKLCEVFFTEQIEKYLEGFSIQFNQNLSTNWFLKIEINFIFELINSRSLQFNPFLLKVAFNLLNCFTHENLDKILFIFENFVFNEKFYYSSNITKEEYGKWKYIYNGVVMSKLTENEIKSQNYAIIENWNQVVLFESWPYSLLLILLYNVEVDASQKHIIETELSEKEIIFSTLKMTNLLEKNKINLITKNQQLMYLMLVYFGKDLDFLESSVKDLIREKLKLMKNFPFPPRFNIKLNREKSFESLYTMFLDTFQSNSYGDELFSILVMIPLMQNYDVKWRKLVWSEYVAAMRFINCSEDELLYNFNDYLYPIEKDESLLKCYTTALSTKLLREGSIPWKIAKHHVESSRK